MGREGGTETRVGARRDAFEWPGATHVSGARAISGIFDRAFLFRHSTARALSAS